MQIPENVRGCVGFIWFRSKSQKGAPRLAGTGFFVRVPFEKFPEHSFVYLVTAKHVIVAARQDSDDDILYIRMNTNNGGSSSIRCHLFSGWVFHPDDVFADVAVIPWAPNINPFQFTTVPRSLFATSDVVERENIDAGDDVFVTGLFVNHVGQHRNLPLIRVGNIAAMPEEPVQTRIGPMDAYLIEVRSIGGLSGSPVFVYLSETRRVPVRGGAPNTATWRGEWALGLLGLIHGHWDLPSPTPDAVAQNSFQNERINMGVAIVVPASKIDETLRHPTLTEMQEIAFRARKDASLPTTDAAVDDSLTKRSFKAALRKVSRRVVEPDEGTS